MFRKIKGKRERDTYIKYIFISKRSHQKIATHRNAQDQIRYVQNNIGTKYLVPSTWYQGLGTKYLVPSAGARYFVPSTWF